MATKRYLFTSQACQLLDTFLNAPEYILAHEELLRIFMGRWYWGYDLFASCNFSFTCCAECSPEISIFQKDINKYQLVLPEKRLI